MAIKDQIKAAMTGVPSKQDALKASQAFVEAQTALTQTQAQVDIEIAQVKEKHADTMERYKRLEEEAREVLTRYAEGNRNEILQDGAKSVKLGAVTIGWKLAKPKLSLAEGFDWKKAVEAARENLKKYVKKSVGYSLMKTEILKDYGELGDEALAKSGLKVEQDERFYIK